MKVVNSVCVVDSGFYGALPMVVVYVRWLMSFMMLPANECFHITMLCYTLSLYCVMENF